MRHKYHQGNMIGTTINGKLIEAYVGVNKMGRKLWQCKCLFCGTQQIMHSIHHRKKCQYCQSNNHILTLLTQEQKEILEGDLLGDGSLTKKKTNANSQYTVKQSIQDEDFVKWKFIQFQNLCTDDYQVRTVVPKNPDKYKRKLCKHFLTRALPVFTKEHSRWYRWGYCESKKKESWIKVVPKDIDITPMVLLVWFLGDGHISVSRGTKVNLYTNCFTLSEVQFLSQILQDRYDLQIRVLKPRPGGPKDRGYILTMTNIPEVIKFFNIIKDIWPINLMTRKKQLFLQAVNKEKTRPNTSRHWTQAEIVAIKDPSPNSIIATKINRTRCAIEQKKRKIKNNATILELNKWQASTQASIKNEP